MIEVEKKFKSDKNNEKALIEGAEFLNEIVFTDSYFDDKDFSLTTKDVWFRDREGRYEIKLPLNEVDIENRVLDQYHELETEKEIAEYFKWDLSKKKFTDWVNESGYKPFATYTTTRRKYKKGEFTIDIDTTDFGFNIIEIELMVEKEEQMQDAIKKILEFASGYNLELDWIRGKLIEYIHRNNSVHFQKLIDERVIK